MKLREPRVFIPASLVSDTYEKDLIQVRRSGDRVRNHRVQSEREEEIIGDRKQLLVAKKAEMQKELFEQHPCW